MSISQEFQKIYDELYYKSGDTFEFDHDIAGQYLIMSGGLTASNTNVYLEFTPPKSMKNISTVTINYITGGVRGGAGGYVIANGTDFSTVGTLATYKLTDNQLSIHINLTTATSMTNNIAVSALIYTMKLTFN